MKRIIALIKDCMLDDVVFALHRLEDFPGATMSEVRDIGCGTHHGGKAKMEVTSLPFHVYVRLEIVCQSQQVDEIVSTIVKNAHTGKVDDGSIVICPVDKVIPIQAGKHKV